METTAASKLLQNLAYHSTVLCVFMFVESVCHTTLYYWKRKQQEAAAAAAAAVAGSQQPLRKHNQTLSGNLKLQVHYLDCFFQWILVTLNTLGSGIILSQ